MGRGRNGQVQTKRMANIVKKTRGNYKKEKGGIGKINDPNRVRPKGATHLRNRATIKRLKMYNDRAIRDKNGIILQQRYMRYETDSPVSRIHPDRRWFGNTKIISQKQLQLFRSEMSKSVRDPYQVVLKSKKLPYGLLDTDTKQTNRMKLLQVESFEDTFGTKMQRKKPKLKANCLESLAQRAVTKHSNYDETLDEDTLHKKTQHLTSFIKGEDKEKIFLSGQSQRIKSELYKVIDSSDVLLQVIDGRDPMGTRSPHIEKYIKTNCTHKHVVLVLNKIDLIPSWCTKRWIKILSKEYPTIAFKANCMNNTKKSATSFGKGALISLLRQFRLLHKSNKKRTISIGLFGFPNVGKSSVINCIVGKKACDVAPIPGQTKVWQYVSLFDRFYLIDCPGVVYPRPGDNVVSSILRSVVRVQLIENPEEYVHEILKRTRKEYIQKLYEIESWTDAFDFMAQIALKRGKLLKGGEPDYHNVSVNVLRDWQRGKIPWFICPPFEDDLELEHKLRNEQKRIEEELRAFTEDKEIEYEPIDTQKQAQAHNAKELEGDKLAITHQFEASDMNEDKYKRDIQMRDNQNGDSETQLECIQNMLNQMSKTDRQKFDNMKVSNPLNLPNDDPLLLESKWRKWKMHNK
eukprot:341817_1